MNYPWKESATLVRTAAAGQSDDQSSTILFEGPLLALALKIEAIKPLDRRRLRLSLPDRHVRPLRFPRFLIQSEAEFPALIRPL